MSKVVWQDIFSVGIAELDEQHRNIINFINDVYSQAESDLVSLDEFSGTYDRILTHAHHHFQTEEKYFQQFQYEGGQIHQIAHQGMIEHIEKLKQDFLLNKSVKNIFEALQFLEDWLFVHIMEYDKKYVDCFHQHGLK